jgi:membrane associated rhomboid family serine protease
MLDLTPPPPPTAVEARRLSARFWRSVYIVTLFIGLLWLILGAISNLHIDTRPFALYPGRVDSLLGILTAPLLHGGAEHLLANSFGLLILGVLTLYRFPASAPLAIGVIWLLSGLGTWWIGRPSFHIGASGLTHGLMFFVFVSGLIRRDRTSIAAAMLTFMFFGGMLLTILPREESISFEYHLSGAIAGLICAFWMRRRDPAPPRRKYSWEIEEELEALRAQETTDAELQMPRPDHVPVLWQRPAEERGIVLQFPVERRDDKPTLH